MEFPLGHLTVLLELLKPPVQKYGRPVEVRRSRYLINKVKIDSVKFHIDLDALELESRLTILRPLERHHLSASCQVKERPVWSQLAR